MDSIQYLDNIQKRLADTYTQITSNYFEAAVSGSEDAFKKSADAQLEYDRILADSGTYAQLEEIAKDEKLPEIYKRTAKILLDESKGRQLPDEFLEELVNLQNEIEKEYTVFRAEVDGNKVNDNDLEQVLSESSDSDEVRKHWTASKAIGKRVEDKLKELVHLRNKAATMLGYENYHSMQLQLNEIEPEWLEKTFDELDALTKPAFERMKQKIDDHLAEKFGLASEDLMPWHYGNRFFQEPPAIYQSGIDNAYRNASIHEMTKKFYDSIGLNIDSVSAKSDLYGKEGKNQHAFCIDIDRTAGDIRVLCNIVPSHRWMDTDLHEFGHAAYDYYLDRSLPWALMTPAHIFTTEAIAMLFGRLAGNVEWVRDNVEGQENLDDGGLAKKEVAMAQIVFSRWAQVMYRFEKAMYADPDQDLQKLWWQLVERYQGLRMPEGREKEADWASKIHIATVPCYYHNYLLGELLASQLQNYITTHISDANEAGMWSGDKKVGMYLKEKVFAPGKSLPWNEMIKGATGEGLTAKYYAAEFC